MPAPSLLLVARFPEHRDALARYLVEAGIEVHVAAALDALRLPQEVDIAVALTASFDGEAVLDAVAAWWGHAPIRPIVLVSEAPVPLRERLPAGPCVVVPAPCFGWHLLDTVRSLLPGAPHA